MRHKIDFCQLYLLSDTVTFQAYYAKTRRATYAWARIFETKIAVVYCESQDLDVTRQYTTDLVFSKRCLSQN